MYKSIFTIQKHYYEARKLGKKRKPGKAPEPRSCTILHKRTLELEGVCSVFRSCKVFDVHYFGSFCSDGVSPQF